MTQGFDTLALHALLEQAIDDLGFSQMTPIQAQVLTFTLAGHDAIGRAQTGTGKTAAFLITVINDLLSNPLSKSERFRGEPRALILAPTRELALQIENDARLLLKYTDLHVVTLVGGVDYDKQRKQLNSAFLDILVATPGRLMDFVEQREIAFDMIDFLVIDEADRLLDMGFIPAVKTIMRKMPPKEARQTLMFSATFNYDVLNLAQQWLFEPVTVEIEPEQSTSAQVEQRMYVVGNNDKERLLKHILTTEPVEKVIIFANRRDQVKQLYERLKREGYKVGMLSGEMPQDKREKMLAHFKTGTLSIMIATDVAGRGIHVNGISHVINYTLPDQVEDYVHRIGRTGRAGALGVSISFASEDDAFMLPELERVLQQKFTLERLD